MAANRLSLGLAGLFGEIRKPEKLAVFGLLLIFLTSAIAGISLTLRGPDWALLWQSLFFGLLLGWTLALLQQSALKTTWIVIAVGLLYILLFPGGLAGRVIAVFAELIRLLLDALSLHKNETIDPGLLIRSIQELIISAGIILKRVQTWTIVIMSGRPAFDPVAAALLWNALVWIVSAWTGWVIEARRNALVAVLPGLSLSLGILAYGQRMTAVLYIMLGAVLLLLAIVQHERRQQNWIKAAVAYPAEKGRQVFNAAFLAMLAIVFLAYFLPSLSVQRIRDWISELRKPAQNQPGNLAESLGVLPGGTPAVDIFQTARSPGLPRERLINSGPELSGRVVMTVAVANLSAIAQGGQPLPLYWRGFTYDVYTGHGWSTSETTQQTYQADASLPTVSAPDHVLIQQDVRPVEDLGRTVYYAGEPTAFNIQSEAAWRSDGDLFGIQAGSSGPYAAWSLIPVADEQTLRNAGQAYPAWVREHFLGLPAEVPERVKALAIKLTASESTPFDRAFAIESYLRTFPYTLDVPPPPSNQDIVDYFLFDLRKGYCDYYASSMVVLARAAGIPARLAIGYATGTYNLNSKRFIVTEADAHSWVEIYFPNIGWVPFEPTASRPALERSEATAAAGNATTPGPPGTVPSRSAFLARLWLLLPAGFALAGIVGCAVMFVDNFRLRQLSAQMAAAEIYRRIRCYGKYLSVPLDSSDTPYEFSAAFGNSLNRLIVEGVDASFEQRVITDVHMIIEGVVRVNYRLPPQMDTRVLRQWKKLRWQFFLLLILKLRNSFIAYARTK